MTSTAAYLSAMPHILDEIVSVTGTHAFHVRNLPLLKGQRVTADGCCNAPSTTLTLAR